MTLLQSLLACALPFLAAAAPRNVLYYAFYQDPWCTANSQSCHGNGCCDDRLHDSQENKTLLNPENWPSCSDGHEITAESVLINPVAPNEHGGLDLDFLGQYYARGAVYYNEEGHELPWKGRNIIQCGGDNHDKPYSYNLPKGAPVPNPLCVPATPPAALERGIAGLKARGIRTGISILGGGGDDNVPGINVRNQLHSLTKLSASKFDSFLVQLRAAATVLHDWGITHFDVDLEGGIAYALNATRLPQVLDALRFEGGMVSITTESWALDGISSVLESTTQRPDLVQLMMGDYSETLHDGLQTAKSVAQRTGYPVSKFRFGIKPQCGVRVGSADYLKSALPEVVESDAGVVLWNLGRDYPCDSGGDCSGRCAAHSFAGQQAFTTNEPFTFTCAISRAFNSEGSSGAAHRVMV